MKIRTIGKHNVAIISSSELLKDYTQAEEFTSEYKPVIRSISKSDKADLHKVLEARAIMPPARMGKLLALLDVDGYHSGCVAAIADGSVMDVVCKNKLVNNWMKESQNQGNIIRIIRSMVHHYQACGNGFVLKIRNKVGQWVGLESLLPQEIALKENYDDSGFLKPNYVQYKSGKAQPYLNTDVIHLAKPTYKSNVWGLSSLPVAQGIETLKEIKQFDYNNFKSGLLIDYIIVVNGGTLNESEELEEGEEGYSLLEEALRKASGSKGGHSTIVIESDEPGVNIQLIPMRQALRDGEFQKLKEDIRNEMFAYHRVPKRIVAQATAGQLGGDNNSDMILFYNLVIKPIQREVGEILNRNFRDEFGWDVSLDDWNFGNLTDLFESDDMKMLKQANS
jgi:capsid portal protein